MRILPDECVPKLLKNDIAGHDVSTVTEIGWAGIKNGKLLDQAEGRFDVLLTVDRNMEYQQSFGNRQIALVVLDGPTKLSAFRLLIPALPEALPGIQRGRVIHVSG